MSKKNLNKLLTAKDVFGPRNSFTSFDRIREIVNDQDYQKEQKIHNILIPNNNEEHYESRKTHYGETNSNSTYSCLNSYGVGTQIFESCPADYFEDGGVEFLTGFSGQATENPSYIITIIPPHGNSISYWKDIENKELKEILKK